MKFLIRGMAERVYCAAAHLRQLSIMSFFQIMLLCSLIKNFLMRKYKELSH